MKKELILGALIVALVWGASPTFAAPLPVPTKMCIDWDSSDGVLSLLLRSQGKVQGIEYFSVVGSFHSSLLTQPMSGSAHRRGKRKLHMTLVGGRDDAGPGGGGLLRDSMIEAMVLLRSSRGSLSIYETTKSYTISGAFTFKIVPCSSVPKPP